MVDRIGIIAGSGQFPVLAAANARKDNKFVVAIGHEGETNSELQNNSDVFETVKLGQLGKIIRILKANQVNQVAFAGAISRPKILSGHAWPDARGLAMLAKTRSVRDDVILRAIAKELENDGITVFSATDLLRDCVPSSGVLTKRSLTEEEKDNAKIGWTAAKLIGQADVGQTVVVSQGLVVAVEAVEGTDATIARAGDLTKNRGGVVVKTCKPQQDQRLDLPTIGVGTIKAISKAGLTALVIEAGKTLILDPVSVVKEADTSNISIESLCF